MRSWIWMGIDCAMLVAVVALQAWRMTGVVLHEWLTVGLLVAVLAHLLLHWPWVASRTRRIAKADARTRVNYALNAVLFAGVTAAMVSGFAISKSILPLHPTPDSYLRWHGIHGFSSRLALFATALHLALNWDRLFARRPRIRSVFRPAAWIAFALVSTIIPRPEIVLIRPDGQRVVQTRPPRDIAELRRDEAGPSARGFPPFVLQGRRRNRGPDRPEGSAAAAGMTGSTARHGRHALRFVVGDADEGPGCAGPAPRRDWHADGRIVPDGKTSARTAASGLPPGPEGSRCPALRLPRDVPSS